MVQGQQGGGEAGLDVGPCPHVLRLLLHPDQLGLGVLFRDALDQLEGEGSDLLQRDDGDVVDLVVLAPLKELVVDLISVKRETN